MASLIHMVISILVYLNLHRILQLPISSLIKHDIFFSGLVGTGKEDFDPTSEVERFQPLTHCWVSESHIYCSSPDNQLLNIDVETGTIEVIYRPPTDEDQEDDDEELEDGEIRDEVEVYQFHCMVFHAEGLLAAGDDGVVRCLNFVGGKVTNFIIT